MSDGDASHWAFRVGGKNERILGQRQAVTSLETFLCISDDENEELYVVGDGG